MHITNMKHKYSKQELELIIQNYSNKGPTWLSSQLGISMKTISKKARRMGLYRGQAKANKDRANSWQFTEWSYDLGYIIGVYLGDGNIYQVPNQTSYFRLSVVDKDFCEATNYKIKKVTGFEGNINFESSKQQWVLNFCNKDFCNWLIDNFGPAKYKQIKMLPTLEANKGMIEGLFDSEGTIDKTIFNLRISGDLSFLPIVCQQLNIIHGPLHKGIRKEKWQSDNFFGYSISIKEYTKAGLGTYIKRKAINGLVYKN